MKSPRPHQQRKRPTLKSARQRDRELARGAGREDGEKPALVARIEAAFQADERA